MAITAPSDIPGLVLWLSAEHEAANYTHGQEMTGWTNLVDDTQVPAGKVSTTGATNPTWESTGGANGGPSVNFANYGLFNLPDVLAGTTSDTGATAVGMVKSSVNTSQGNWLRYSANNDQCYYPNNATPRIYDNFMIRRNWFDASLPATSWRRVDIRTGGNTGGSPVYGDSQDYKLDGTTQTFLWSKDVWGGGGTLPRRLGNSRYADPPNTAERWQGRLGCVLLYDRALTTAERSDLDAWLVANPSGGTVPVGPPSGTIAGTLPALSGSLAGTHVPPPVTGVIAGSLSALSGSFAGQVVVAPVDGSLAGVLPALSGSVAAQTTVVVPTGDRYANDGYNYTGLGLVEFDPPIAPTPARVRREVTRRVHQSLPAPTLVDGRPV